MIQLKTKVSDIKAVAKNLAQSLEKDMKVKISHSAALNLASRSLGFPNYNIYKASNEVSPPEEYHREKTLIGSKTLSELKREVTQKYSEKYPSIDDNFIKFGQTSEYDIFVCKEESIHFLLFRLKNNFTNRVFFNTRYESLSLFVYPDVKAGFNSYDISIKDIPNKSLKHKYFSVTKHLIRTKKWVYENLEVMHDLLDLMEALEKDRSGLQNIMKEHSEEALSNLWFSQRGLEE